LVLVELVERLYHQELHQATGQVVELHGLVTCILLAEFAVLLAQV